MAQFQLTVKARTGAGPLATVAKVDLTVNADDLPALATAGLSWLQENQAAVVAALEPLMAKAAEAQSKAQADQTPEQRAARELADLLSGRSSSFSRPRW